jgi:Trypsin-like peptidase domain
LSEESTICSRIGSTDTTSRAASRRIAVGALVKAAAAEVRDLDCKGVKGLVASSASESNMRFAFALCLAMALVAPIVSKAADQTKNSDPWIATAGIMRNGGPSGSGVYLKSGLIITAAHLTDLDAEMSVRIAGVLLPAKVLKQGSLEDVDLSLLMFDEEKLARSIELPRMQLCAPPPWPGDPVIVVDAGRATRSHIVSPQVLPLGWRSKFATLIADVATTGDSGSGVFDPNHKCLLGIISRKLVSHTTGGDIDIAKYFVPAVKIRDFMPAEVK